MVQKRECLHPHGGKVGHGQLGPMTKIDREAQGKKKLLGQMTPGQLARSHPNPWEWDEDGVLRDKKGRPIPGVDRFTSPAN